MVLKNTTTNVKFIKHNIAVLDESMSSWKPMTAKHGRIPHLLFVISKPDYLGTDLKTVCGGGEGGLHDQSYKSTWKGCNKKFRVN